MTEKRRLLGFALVLIVIIGSSLLFAHDVNHNDSDTVECQLCEFAAQYSHSVPVVGLQVEALFSGCADVPGLPDVCHFRSSASNYLQRAPPFNF